MEIKSGRWTVAVLVVAALMFCGHAAAQNQTSAFHHYKLVIVGTLGGPTSFLSGPELLVLNDQGMFAAFANTATPNPNSNCYVGFNAPDCFVEHAIVLQNGKLTELPVLPGGATAQTAGISASGQIVGGSENGLIDPQIGLPEIHATLWTTAGKIIDLNTLPGGTESAALAINALGQAVGFSNNNVSDPFSMLGLPTQARAFLWQNGVMKDLGTLGGADAIASYVNAAGQVSGSAYTDSNFSTNCGSPLTTHAFFWENDKMTDVGTFGGSCSNSGWMNNRGQIVGYANTADENNHAFVWDKQEGLKNLGELPGGIFSFATWINDAGEIVGGSDASAFFHAVLWKNGAIIDLGTVYGEGCSSANSINSAGQVVGFASADCFNEDHAFLAQNGAIVDVNTLVVGGSDLTPINAYDINDRGEIAGWGVLATGEVRAFLLVPCDGNHLNIQGCDYSLVEPTSVTTGATTLAKPARFSSATMMMRMRARMAGRYHRF